MTTEETTIENAFDIAPAQDAPTMPERFDIDTDARAEWLLRILANNEAEKSRVTQQAQEIVAALEADSASLLFKYGAALEIYCREKIAAGGNRRKSVRFLQGTCSFRYSAPAVRIKDSAAALNWAKQNAPLLVGCELVERLDTELYRKEAEQRRAALGELLPGVEYSEGGDAFSLSFPKEIKPKRPKG